MAQQHCRYLIYITIINILLIKILPISGLAESVAPLCKSCLHNHWTYSDNLSRKYTKTERFDFYSILVCCCLSYSYRFTFGPGGVARATDQQCRHNGGREDNHAPMEAGPRYGDPAPSPSSIPLVATWMSL